MTNLGRRKFFQANFSQSTVIRPPWAVSEQQFTELCSRCDECIMVCPEKVIIKGSAGFPEVNFNDSGCELCEDCLDVCQIDALVKISGEQSGWSHKVKITDRCLPENSIICRTCFEICDHQAIRMELAAGKVAKPKLKLNRCTGCGFCIAACPVDAIVIIQMDVQKF